MRHTDSLPSVVSCNSTRGASLSKRKPRFNLSKPESITMRSSGIVCEHSQEVAESIGMEPPRRTFRVGAGSVIEKPNHLLGKDDSGNYRGDMVLARIFREYR